MRRFLSLACFTLGTLWAAAGVLRFLFGVRMTLPILPPFGLERVVVVPSVVTGLVLFAIGAVLGRQASIAEKRAGTDATLAPSTLLDEPSPFVVTPVRPPSRQPNER